MAATVWLLLAMTLYLLLHRVDQLAAAAMVIFAAVGSAVMSLNQLNQLTALTVATGADYARGFGKPGADALTLLFANMQHNGYVIDDMFFGLWLLGLGWLVVRSGLFRRVLDVLLGVACVGYLVCLFATVLASHAATTVARFVTVPAAAAGEFTFLLWLTFKGVGRPMVVGAPVDPEAVPVERSTAGWPGARDGGQTGS